MNAEHANPHRLLLIDDNRDITDILEEVGEDADYEVRSVNHYPLIIPAIEEFEPSVIFLDLNLGPAEAIDTEEIPREGLEILKYLAEKGSDTKIVIVSGLSRRKRELNQYLGRDMNLKVVGSISKPFDINQVTEVLEKLKS